MARPHVLILGAGLSGLTAAWELSARGFPVTLLEQSSTPGGRAKSWLEADGIRVGNLNHTVAGWQRNVRSLLDRLGTTGELVDHAGSAVYSRDRLLSRPDASPLPQVMQRLTESLPVYKGFSAREKVSSLTLASLLATYRGERLERLDEISLRAWGVGFNASMRPFLRHLLEPFTLYALTSTGQPISARTASVVLRHWLNNPLPFVSSFPQSVQASLIEPLAAKVKAQGAVLRTSSRVQRFLAGRTRLEGVQLKSGERVEADVIISTLPPDRLQACLTPEMLRYHCFRELTRLRSHPLASLQLFFRTKALELHEPIIYSDSELGVFAVDVSPYSSYGQGGGTVLSCVLTRYDAYAGLPQEELIALVMEELRILFPQLRPSWLEHYSLQRNHHAPCFLHLTGSWRHRPSTRSPLKNLLLAGDWVRQAADLACMEGAVLSALGAVNQILQAEGLPLAPVITTEDGLGLRTVRRLADVADAPRQIFRKLLPRVDRRASPRVELAMDGYMEDVESQRGWTPVMFVNSSLGGVYVVTEASPRPGAQIRLKLTGEGGEQVQLRARVLRVEEVRDRQGGGMGVACRVEPEDEGSEEAWERQLEGLTGEAEEDPD